MKSRFASGVLSIAALLTCALPAARGQSFELRSKVYGGTFDGYANRLTIAAGDLDGDGDPDLMGGFAEGGLVYLRNPEAKLPVSPPSQTVLAGESVAFETLGTTGTVQWAYVRNASSGTLDTVTGVYTSGVNSGTIDVIEGYDPATELKGRAYVNIISLDDIARAGKAIVLAGRRSASDPLWSTTDYLANRGYNTLLYRGYSKDTVHYLSPVPGRDVDGNAADDDIDAQTTFANTAFAFTNFAANSDKLFIHMVDHGGDSSGEAYFRLNASETLSAAQLDTWLDDIQDAYSNEVTVLIDCCYAGSFLDELTYDGEARRTVIAACGATEPTYFVAGGLVSFSDAFFSGMLLGLNVEESFNLARDAMSAYQDAAMTGNGEVEIGASFVAGKDLPQIGEVCDNQTLEGETAATLWVDRVVAVHPVQRVRALIVPPGHNPDPDDPVANLPKLDLAYRGGGRYEGTYSGFSRHGTYNVLVYAEDIWGSVSLPRQTYVTQTGFDERVILLAGGETNDAPWTAINNMARTAYHTFRSRWLSADQVRYLCPAGAQDIDGDGTNDVDAAPSIAELTDSVTNWAFGANKLTVYVIGDKTNNAVRVNRAESLAGAALDEMLDAYEAEGGSATLIVESPCAGTLVNAMTPLPGKPRIGIAASEPGRPCCWANDGLVSFSQFFLSYVFRGSSLGSAYSSAKYHIYRAAGRRVRQRPLLTDPETTATDRYIGTAFLTGAESPEIAAVTPPSALTDTSGVLLWASGVTDMDGISNVWCVVTSPDYDGEDELPRTNLAWNAASERYEAHYAAFGLRGTNVLTFSAMDTTGEISVPAQSEVVAGGDPYEVDDTAALASFHSGSTQAHTFHASNDADWVMFYASTNISAYEIVSTNVSTNLTTSLTLYYQEADGSLTWIDSVTNDPVSGLAESYVDFAFGDAEGFYLVKLTGAGTGDWLPGEYELEIGPDVGGGGLLMVVAVDMLTGRLAPSAVINWSGGGTNGAQAMSAPSALLTGLHAGVYTVEVAVATGYLPEEDPDVPGAPGDPESPFGTPRHLTVAGDELRTVLFRFVPMLTVDGLLRGAWTGERIEGARLEFTARSGVISNLVYNAYPNFASYAVPWKTRPNGTFPTNVLLPAVRWDLIVKADNYADLALTGAVTNPVPGEVVELGVLYATPIDANSNSLADAWEDRYGGGLDPDADPDGDGHDTRTEQRAGTDPTNAMSVLALEPPAFTLDGIILRWPVAPGRRYTVDGRPILVHGPWSTIHGPLEAPTGEMHMQHTVSNGLYRFYRVGLGN